ncbi:hypothetical protein Acor_79380 [Acrocarpospora corrugata]|uniref:Resolvase/invertase-type recombinase catalytic domain-containing protein n=1 Tax=Acrocarpospora corrugata TaxID=35763 RepID=A0A5M3WC06_9ACTN|nr:hypothetical protein Acor_79380 [Acrocarpospora corrugata]
MGQYRQAEDPAAARRPRPDLLEGLRGEDQRQARHRRPARPLGRPVLHSRRDLLAVQEVDRLGRNLLEGLIVLNDLFQQGIGVKVLEGIGAGEHTERSFILDLALALAEDRRRDIVKKTLNGLEAARRQGELGGRRPVVDDDKRAAILDRHRRGESIRTIAAGVKVSIGVVHKTITEARPLDQTT